MEKISTGVLDSFWKQKAADSLEERTRMDGGDEAICELSGFDTLQTETMAGMFLDCPFLQGEQELLAQMANLSEQYEGDIQKKALEFNIFKMAGIQEKETIMCRVLYGLLEPNGTHGMGIECLKLFLEDVLQLGDLEADEFRTAKIFREYVIPDSARRIDLVIETRYRFLPIEVKIYAEEQEGQCYDYYTFAMGRMAQRAGNKSWKLYYLTLDGRLPSEKSTKGSVECCRLIRPISWGAEIRQWLGHIESMTENQNVKEVLKQFIAAILSLANQNEMGFQKILNELLWQPGNMKSAQLIAKGLEAAKTEFLRNLYYEIKKEADVLYADRYLEVYPLDEQITKYHKGRDFPGLTYQIHSFNSENKHGEKETCILAMHFQIEWRSEIGFVLIRKPNEPSEPYDYEEQQSVDDGTRKLAFTFLKTERSKSGEPEGWWLDWFYVPTFQQEAVDAVPNFLHCNDAYYQLYDKAGKKAFIRSVINGFSYLYRQVEWKEIEDASCHES